MLLVFVGFSACLFPLYAALWLDDLRLSYLMLPLGRASLYLLGFPWVGLWLFGILKRVLLPVSACVWPVSFGGVLSPAASCPMCWAEDSGLGGPVWDLSHPCSGLVFVGASCGSFGGFAIVRCLWAVAPVVSSRGPS